MALPVKLVVSVLTQQNRFQSITPKSPKTKKTKKYKNHIPKKREKVNFKKNKIFS